MRAVLAPGPRNEMGQRHVVGVIHPTTRSTAIRAVTVMKPASCGVAPSVNQSRVVTTSGVSGLSATIFATRPDCGVG